VEHCEAAKGNHQRDDIEGAFNASANDNLLNVNGISKDLRAAPNWQLSWQEFLAKKFLTNFFYCGLLR
jgi:hypothetical protein